MDFELRLDSECPSDWNNQLLKSPFGNVFNTFEYSQYTKNRLGWNPLFFSMIDSSGNIRAQAVIYNINSNKLGKFSKIFPKKFSKFKWIYGPVIFSKDFEVIIDTFLNYFSNLNKKIDGTLHPLYGVNFNNSHLQLQKWSTFLIDLKQSKEFLLNKMNKKSVIKNIKRSEERGVKIIKITDSSIGDYHKILNQYRKENHNSVYDFEDTKQLWDILKPTGFSGYLAKKDDMVIGGITFSSFNGYLNEWGIARSNIDKTEKLYSQDLLKWKIIEWGINNNQNFFDLSGFNPNPENSKEKGILDYKKKWGGIQKDYVWVRN